MKEVCLGATGEREEGSPLELPQAKENKDVQVHIQTQFSGKHETLETL